MTMCNDNRLRVPEITCVNADCGCTIPFSEPDCKCRLLILGVRRVEDVKCPSEQDTPNPDYLRLRHAH